MITIQFSHTHLYVIIPLYYILENRNFVIYVQTLEWVM
jgi:hypothetical protein